VDEKEKDVKQGEVGELIVRGSGVMREYYKNPEATANTLKKGWLYTGDMARQDEEGFIYLVDRKKDVIIWRRRECVSGGGGKPCLYPPERKGRSRSWLS